ncbi:hypothetical protein EDC56_1284 [Sinobacterium caligoides]|uniref:Uncharacterized protein n=1 Tax=Sinobacterium caligoides TaxID=933926 RepID=A0A3N2E0T3_9GAMM|nr:hypothetical protein [Sinobacterium caligoides]ROS05733.1 hypothetical protein EDC56_1284 [Sinobacterium caligoides]
MISVDFYFKVAGSDMTLLLGDYNTNNVNISFFQSEVVSRYDKDLRGYGEIRGEGRFPSGVGSAISKQFLNIPFSISKNKVKENGFVKFYFEGGDYPDYLVVSFKLGLVEKVIRHELGVLDTLMSLSEDTAGVLYVTFSDLGVYCNFKGDDAIESIEFAKNLIAT